MVCEHSKVLSKKHIIYYKNTRKNPHDRLRGKINWKKAEKAENKKLFFGGGIFLAVLTGALIPSTVIKASPIKLYFGLPWTSLCKNHTGYQIYGCHNNGKDINRAQPIYEFSDTSVVYACRCDSGGRACAGEETSKRCRPYQIHQKTYFLV